MVKMSMSEAGKLGYLASKQKQEDNHKLVVSQYNASPKACGYCGKSIVYEKRCNKFCDHSCAAKFNNKDVARNVAFGTYVKKACLNCGAITKNTIYCSKNCCLQHKWREISQKIRSEGTLPLTDSGYGYNPKIAKRYLSETRGRCCEICKGETWMDKLMPLVLDHVNGNPDDHRIDNLRLVCGNCNMQLPTFCGKNLGRGRKWRKEVFG